MVVKQVLGLCLLGGGSTLREAAKEFLLDMKVAGRAQSTRTAYEIVLAFLAQHAEEYGWPPVGELSVAHLRQYLAVTKDRPKWFGERDCGQSPISVSYYETIYRRTKRFFNWLVEEGAIPENPMARIAHPKIGKRVIDTVSDSAFFTLLELTDPKLYAKPSHLFRAIRDRAVLWLLVANGGRRAEITALTTDNVRLEEKRVLVDGKGNRQSPC